MRITNNTMNRTFLNNVNKSMRRMLRAQERATTGKAVSKPSDDPLLVGKILSMRDNIEQNEQYNSNISDALGWVKTQDTALDSVNKTMNRVRDLIVYGANGSLSDTDRNAIRDEVETSLAELKDILNTNFDGRYIFGGQKTDKPPFGEDLGYNGAGGDISRGIAQGVSIDLKTQGSEIITTTVEKVVRDEDGKPILDADGNPKMEKVEQELGDFFKEILDAMDSTKPNDKYRPKQDPNSPDYQPIDPGFGHDYVVDYDPNTPEFILADPDKLSGELLDGADSFIDNILRFRSQVGAIHNRLESSELRNREENTNLNEVLSEKEDVDLAESYMEYIMMMTGYQASLSMGAKILQPSLMDYLR